MALEIVRLSEGYINENIKLDSVGKVRRKLNRWREYFESRKTGIGKGKGI